MSFRQTGQPTFTPMNQSLSQTQQFQQNQQRQLYHPPSNEIRYQQTQFQPWQSDTQRNDRQRPYSAQPTVQTRQMFPSEPTEQERRLFESTSGAGINFDKYDEIHVQVSGNNVIPPIESYEDIDLGPALNRNIVLAGYKKPTPIQKHSIPIILGGRDLMACAQTGSGKTCAFLLPILRRLQLVNNKGGKVYDQRRLIINPAALVVAPTRELCIQIFEEASKFSNRTDLLVCVCYGGKNLRDQIYALRSYGCDLLVATPGRLIDLLQQGIVGMSHIQTLCLDEADRMLDMGFEPQIRQIVEGFGMPPAGRRQTVMFSATFPKEIQRLAALFLQNYLFCVVGTVGETAKDIVQKFERVYPGSEFDTLLRLLPTLSSPQSQGPSSSNSNLILIFTETKREANNLDRLLNARGYPSTSIHGDRTQNEREAAMYAFRSGRVQILVATDVASRGIDIPEVRVVINYSMPNEFDRYVHRIGRTGRVGNVGTAITFIKNTDTSMIGPLIDNLEQSGQEIPPFFYEIGGSRLYSNTGNRGKWAGGRDVRNESRGRGGYKSHTFTHRGRGGGAGGQYGQNRMSFQPHQTAGWGDSQSRMGGEESWGGSGGRGGRGGFRGGRGRGGGQWRGNDGQRQQFRPYSAGSGYPQPEPYPTPSPPAFTPHRPQTGRDGFQRNTVTWNQGGTQSGRGGDINWTG
ncbi:putative ATP-dependent RNA helicase bel [Blattamonas nauphoetae]|uniref:RNA helicase n=1 Tax=Blattamonas nauphoetae TaxID=2049346 RepID=A0ABQ9X864_9EUKA|nr:putative ATP-dependent RNA helicase bel [Blattamonas nauphoetae]